MQTTLEDARRLLEKWSREQSRIVAIFDGIMFRGRVEGLVFIDGDAVAVRDEGRVLRFSILDVADADYSTPREALLEIREKSEQEIESALDVHLSSGERISLCQLLFHQSADRT